ncbi:MAG TPA: DsbA family protein [Paenirhodobacter sp.]
MNAKIFATTLALWGAALPAGAFDLSAMSDSEKAAFGQAVRDYLMQNPEVLVEAINVLDQRQQAASQQSDQAIVQANQAALLSDPDDWVGGNPQGDITIVEFMDYKCGYCKKSYPDVAKLMKSDGNIRFVVKEFPILGPQSELGARFAVAVKQIAGDAAYEKTHDALMTARGDLTPETLKRMALAQKLDAEAILQRMDSPEVTAVLQKNMELAQKMAISGTPAFIIGGDMLRGYAPYEAMRQIVQEQRG